MPSVGLDVDQRDDGAAVAQLRDQRRDVLRHAGSAARGIEVAQAGISRPPSRPGTSAPNISRTSASVAAGLAVEHVVGEALVGWRPVGADGRELARDAFQVALQRGLRDSWRSCPSRNSSHGFAPTRARSSCRIDQYQTSSAPTLHGSRCQPYQPSAPYIVGYSLAAVDCARVAN